VHSADGDQWTAASSTGTSERLAAVTWDGDRFVAVGGRGTILHSSDGDRWISASNSAAWSSIWLYGVASNGNLIVAVANDGTILHSSDGDYWTEASHSATSFWLEDVVWNGTRFVAVGSDLVHSPDGDTWTASSTDLSAFTGVAWSGALFVAVGRGGIAYSSDGDNWAEATDSPDPTLRQLSGVEWGGALFVSIGQTLLSADGIDWTEARDEAADSDITWTGTHFWSVGYTRMSTSSNGSDWHLSRVPGMSIRGAAYSGPDSPDVGPFVGVGHTTDGASAMTLYASDLDNVMWETHPWPALLGVVWNGSRLVAVGVDGTIVYSSDGISWTAASNSATSQWLHDVTWTGSRFVAVGTAGTIVHSSDGSSWTRVRESGTANDLLGIAWNGTRFVAVGLNGTIVVSP
jgi:photosystem II stability/assembly factor-like uncharacterized protein